MAIQGIRGKIFSSVSVSFCHLLKQPKYCLIASLSTSESSNLNNSSVKSSNEPKNERNTPEVGQSTTLASLFGDDIEASMNDILENLIPKEEAKIFSGITVEDYNKSNISLPVLGKINILGIGFNQRSFDMVEPWMKKIQSLEETMPNLTSYQLSVNQKAYMNSFLLRPMITRAFFSGMEPEFLEKSCIYFGDFNNYKAELGIKSVRYGYILLFDQEGKLRWRINGDMTENKFNMFNNCLKDLNI